MRSEMQIHSLLSSSNWRRLLAENWIVYLKNGLLATEWQHLLASMKDSRLGWRYKSMAYLQA